MLDQGCLFRNKGSWLLHVLVTCGLRPLADAPLSRFPPADRLMAYSDPDLSSSDYRRLTTGCSAPPLGASPTRVRSHSPVHESNHMTSQNPVNIELATVAFLELTPSLRQQIQLLTPQGSTREQAGDFLRQKAWAERCNAARQCGKQPADYAAQVIELYRAQIAKGRLRTPPPRSHCLTSALGR